MLLRYASSKKVGIDVVPPPPPVFVGLIKTTSGYNGDDPWVTLLFDEMKIKENVILVEHRELHWFY